MASLLALPAFAQNEFEDERMGNIDWSEDSTEVTTIQDIIKQQQKVTTTIATEQHYVDVWGRRSYFNIAYNSTTLSPKDVVPTGLKDNSKVRDMSSDWGVSIQYGRSYRLHKKPINNMFQFYVDYTGIDLNANHFKAEKAGGYCYDSSNYVETGESYRKDKHYYTPWNMEKYEFNYGMSIGPSLTIAPFTASETTALHFLKLNVYYHIGYHISLLYMPNDDSVDANTDTSSNDRKDMDDALKMEWGHGLINSFGFNISWKAIGIGYEYRSASLKYKPMNTSNFGDDKYKFSLPCSRVYIQIRM